MMLYQKRLTSSGKLIEIYDDVFPPYLRQHHILFAQQSSYTLNRNASSGIQWQLNDTFFLSLFSPQDVFLFKFENDDLIKKISEYELQKSWIICSSPLSNYFYHTDCNPFENKITVLYYLNNRWDRNWGGETLFANESGECEVAVEYKPGRVVIFDSAIEHKPAAISTYADEFRFIFVMQLIKK
jgi:SM-20-related protein